MAAGLGYTDAQGVYHFGESDDEGSISDTLNLLPDALATRLALDDARLDALELAKPIAQGTFTTAAALTFTSLFTSTHRRFRLLTRFRQSASASMSAQLRAASTPHTAGYDYQLLQGAATSVTAARVSNAANWQLAGVLGINGEHDLDLLISHPTDAARRTFFRSESVSVDGNDAFNITYTGAHRTAAAYNGISIYPSAGTITGEYTLYGIPS